MRFKKSISTLVICIIVLSFIASAYGIFSTGGPGQYDFKSIHGETVKIYGKGLYRYDSVSTAVQGIAQDKVNLALGIPLLVISIFLARRGLLKGRLLLAGILGYFLYTYISYLFLWMYNPFFLVYVVLVSVSFFAFTLTMMSFDLEELESSLKGKLPVRFLGGFLIFVAAAITLMWLGRIIPPLLNAAQPLGLEHYTTLVIQGLDLGFIVPVAALTGILVLKRNPYGYLLAPVVIFKGFTLSTAVTTMALSQVNAGVKISLTELAVFVVINLVLVYPLIVILKSVKEPRFHQF